MGGPTSSDYLLMLGLLIPHTHSENKYAIPSVYYCDQTDAPGHRDTAAQTHRHTQQCALQGESGLPVTL